MLITNTIAARMKIALPLTADHRLADPFGQATGFRIFDLAADRRSIRRSLLVVTEHKRPCQWPTLLHAAGVSLLLAGRIGASARSALLAKQVAVLAGLPPHPPEQLVADWMTGQLHPRPDRAVCACHAGAGGAAGRHAHADDCAH